MRRSTSLFTVAADRCRLRRAIQKRLCRAKKKKRQRQRVVQEVFLRVIERRGQYRGDASPATWLYAVATLHCLQQLRDQAGRIAKLAQLAEQPRDTPARSPEERLAIAKLLDEANPTTSA